MSRPCTVHLSILVASSRRQLLRPSPPILALAETSFPHCPPPLTHHLQVPSRQPPLHINHLFATTASPPPPLPAPIESHFLIHRFHLPSPTTSKHLPDQPPFRVDHLPMPTISPTPPFPSPHQPKPIFPSIIASLSLAYHLQHLLNQPPPRAGGLSATLTSSCQPKAHFPIHCQSPPLARRLQAPSWPPLYTSPIHHTAPLPSLATSRCQPHPMYLPLPSSSLHPISSSPLQPLSSIPTSSICFII